MKGFRVRPTRKAGYRAPQSAMSGVRSRPGPDSGPVIILVEGSDIGRDALAWAAAEAAARGSELRIVHGLYWPSMVDPLGNSPLPPLQAEAASAVVDAAEQMARWVAPTLRITSYRTLEADATALIGEVRRARKGQALVVLGRSQRPNRAQQALIRRLLRSTTAAVAVVGLSDHDTYSPLAGRVVVAADGRDGPPEVLEFAFRAAYRRGVGLTIIHAAAPGPYGGLRDAVNGWQAAYPEVDVQWRFPTGAVVGNVVAATGGAALTVLGSGRQRRLRGSLARDVQRLALGPVVLVRT